MKNEITLKKTNLQQLDSPDLREIVETYKRPLVSIGYRMLGNWEDAREVVQDAFVRFWKACEVIDDSGKLFSFLAKITTNLCIDRLRRKRQFLLLPWFSEPGENEIQAENRTEDEYEKNQILELIKKMTQRLKPKQKAVFVLRDLEGYSPKEIARILGCSENNVICNVRLARNNMRKWLKPYLQE